MSSQSADNMELPRFEDGRKNQDYFNKILDQFSDEMRRNFQHEMLVDVVMRRHVTGSVESAALDYFSDWDTEYPDGSTITDRKEYEATLLKIGITKERIVWFNKEIRGLEKFFKPSWFEFTRPQYSIRNDIIEISTRSMKGNKLSKFSLNLSANTGSPGPPGAMPGPPQHPFQRLAFDQGESQVFTVEKELCFRDTLELDHYMKTTSGGQESLDPEDFAEAEDEAPITDLSVGPSHVRYLVGKDKQVTMFHGSTLGQYNQMLNCVSWQRLFAGPTGDLNPDHALYFTNNYRYALMWSCFKDLQCAHLNTSWEKTVGTVIAVRFNPHKDLERIAEVRSEVAEDYYHRCTRGDMDVLLTHGTMVCGGFPKSYLAELEKFKTKFHSEGGEERDIKHTISPHEYLGDVHRLRQVALRGRLGEEWLNKREFVVYFVRVGGEVASKY